MSRSVVCGLACASSCPFYWTILLSLYPLTFLHHWKGDGGWPLLEQLLRLSSCHVCWSEFFIFCDFCPNASVARVLETLFYAPRRLVHLSNRVGSVYSVVSLLV